MARRALTRRVESIDAMGNCRVDRFRPYAAAVVVFGGEEATPARVDVLAKWLANGGRSSA